MVSKALSYKMPPEWARHSGTFMEWPVVEAVWPGPFEEVLSSYANIVKAISEFEPVILIARPDCAGQAASYCGGTAKILELPHDDSWIRDNGPTFVANDRGELIGLNWIFNAWGGKYPCENDNMVAARILSTIGVPCLDVPVVMEGGSIHVDGEGTLLTTEECLLNPNRNIGMSRDEIERTLCEHLGVEKFIWLKKGLYGDDTDGHIDNVSCFARPGTIIMQVSRNPEDPNYEQCMENIEILRKSADARGRNFEIIEIEAPPVQYYEGVRLTLSYLNFYFVNGGIILPVFGGECAETDEKARKVLEAVFPERRIVTVDGLVVARGGGNVHCLTQQMPAGVPAESIL